MAVRPDAEQLQINPARRDENIDYYLDKLKSLYKKFTELLAG